MKYYKIKLPHTPDGYVYPPNYEQEIGVNNQGHIYYDDPADGMFTLVISIPDDKAVGVLPANVTEITENEAFTIANQFDPKVTTITNEAVVRLIEIKSRLGLPLSQKEQDALDPETGELGFGMTENMVDKVNKAKALEGK